MRSWQTLRINLDSAWHDGATQKEARAVSHWRLLFQARFWIDLAQSTGVPSWRRYLEPCPPLVRVFDYRFAGKTTIIGLLHTIPPIVLGPFIGVYVDRLPKKFFLIGSNALRAVLIGVLPCAIQTDPFTVNLFMPLSSSTLWRCRCSIRR